MSLKKKYFICILPQTERVGIVENPVREWVQLSVLITRCSTSDWTGSYHKIQTRVRPISENSKEMKLQALGYIQSPPQPAPPPPPPPPHTPCCMKANAFAARLVSFEAVYPLRGECRSGWQPVVLCACTEEFLQKSLIYYSWIPVNNFDGGFPQILKPWP